MTTPKKPLREASKATQMRELAKKGHSVSEIAALHGVSYAYAYNTVVVRRDAPPSFTRTAKPLSEATLGELTDEQLAALYKKSLSMSKREGAIRRSAITDELDRRDEADGDTKYSRSKLLDG